jgi:hypothetical protein
MTSNLKVILSAVGVAALVASPAMAKTERHHHAAPSLTSVPADVHAYASPYAGHPLVTPYAPDVPQQAHETPGPNPDFQLGSEK